MGNYLSWQKSQASQYGWKKDSYDVRDQYHNFTVSNVQSSIKTVDLRDRCPPIYNQGQLGSCTANAIAGAYEFDMIKEGEKSIFTPSRLFIYYNERKMEGTVDQDSGAEIRDGIKSINRVGVCPEKMWPYDIARFTDQPTDECYVDAHDHRAVEYKRVPQNLEQLRQCLIEGYPFVYGFVVYESMETPQVAQTGIVPMPKPNEKILGGHAIMAVGFDNEKRVFIFRNSWGESWGESGYGTMPYDYVINSDLASDFWTVRRVKDHMPRPLEPEVAVAAESTPKRRVSWAQPECDYITHNPFCIPEFEFEECSLKNTDGWEIDLPEVETCNDDLVIDLPLYNKEDHHGKKKSKSRRFKPRKKNQRKSF